MPLARLLGRENQISREYWLDRLSSLPNASNIPIAERLRVAQGGMLDFNLAGTKISDLSPLHGMPLASLDLSGCSELRSIEALRGMPLHQLNLTRTGVTSLDPLAEVRALEDLNVTEIPVTDLSPLTGLPLRKLALVSTKVSDLSPLHGMPLTHLEVAHTRVTDFSPLKGMPLKLLECSYTPVEDYQPLAKLPLENLAVQGARVGDLGFTRDLPLKRLVLAGARDVSNINVLNEIKTLELLVLPGNPLNLADPEVEAVESLKNHPTLKRISYTLSQGSDADSTEGAEIFWRKWDAAMRWWRPLRAAGINLIATRYPDDTWNVSAQRQPLESLAMFTGSTVSVLDVSGCHSVSDLSPLRDLPLHTLAIAHTAVTDLSPLRNMALRNLWMADTKVTDLSPLRAMPLKVLHIDKCLLISDLAPLLDIASLEEVLLPESAVNVESLRVLPKLRRISYTYDMSARRVACAAAEFWQQYHDLGWLRRLRAATTSLSANQGVDGTWAVSVPDAKFSDLAMLKGARISVLTLKGTSVVDVRPLAELALRRLRLDETPCKDVTALARIQTLESLVLPADATGVGALRKLPALKRVAFAADANGEPALDVATFWATFDKKGGR
jgi:Leucine-rich repeat (LRR) protein